MSLKLRFVLLLLSLNQLVIFSQYNFEMGLSVGAANHFGEIGGKNTEAKGFVGDLLLKQTTPSASWFFRYKITPHFFAYSSLGYVRLSGDDQYSLEGPRYWRNLRFINNIIEWTSKIEYVFLDIPDLGRKGRYNTSLNLYGCMGFTLLHHSPRGSLDGENWVNLRPMQTEGFPYKRVVFGTPIGGGLVITHNRYTRFGLVLNYVKTFTDYIDDISNIYVDPSILPSSDAAAYANQSTGVVPEAEKYNFMPGERRGDPTDDDNYATLSLTYSRYLLGQNKYYRNASRWKTKNYYSPRGFKRSKSRIIRSKF